MKRRILFLGLIIAILSNYNTQNVFAQDNKDIQEIEKVAKAFLTGFFSEDIDSMMEQISMNYYGGIKGKIIDYTEFKLRAEKRLNKFYSNNLNPLIFEIKIVKSNIKDNKGVVVIECTYKCFNISAAQWATKTAKRKAFFSKENGGWKIVRWVGAKK